MAQNSPEASALKRNPGRNSLKEPLKDPLHNPKAKNSIGKPHIVWSLGPKALSYESLGRGFKPEDLRSTKTLVCPMS